MVRVQSLRQRNIVNALRRGAALTAGDVDLSALLALERRGIVRAEPVTNRLTLTEAADVHS